MADFRRVAYHETVWLAVTTTAPVIALANLVAIGDSYTLRHMFTRGLEGKMPEWRLALVTKGARMAFYIYTVGFVNLTIQATMTGDAFLSLIRTVDVLPVSLVPGAEGLGLVACGWCALMAATARYRHSRDQTESDGREDSSRVKPHTRPPYPIGAAQVRPRPPAWQRRNTRLRAQAQRRRHG